MPVALSLWSIFLMFLTNFPLKLATFHFFLPTFHNFTPVSTFSMVSTFIPCRHCWGREGGVPVYKRGGAGECKYNAKNMTL